MQLLLAVQQIVLWGRKEVMLVPFISLSNERVKFLDVKKSYVASLS